MLNASWACFALILLNLNLATAEEVVKKDTIQFNSDQGCKILFIGDNVVQMTGFTGIDSLVSMLNDDLRKASAQSDFPSNPRIVHYFVTENGKRRLKAEDNESMEPPVDINAEKQSLLLDLPSNVYFIYDLKDNYEIRIYVNDKKQLESLVTNFQVGLKVIKDDIKSIKSNYKVTLNRSATGWVVVDKQRKRNDMIEMSPNFGLGLIGNTWSPSVGADLSLIFSNKYGLASVKFGATFSGFTFAVNGGMDFSKINFVQSFGLKAMYNISDSYDHSYKSRWVGLSGGMLKADKNSILNKSYKFGFVAEGFGAFNFSFDAIIVGKKKSVYGLTMVFPF